MPRKLCLTIALAALYMGLVAYLPRPAESQPPRLDQGAARALLSAADATATAPAPTAVATLAVVDTTQPMAAVILIWAVIIIAVAVTVFLIWWTRPKR